MNDLISRQAAINAVNTALFPKINTAKDAEKALRDLPSAQPESRREWYMKGYRDAQDAALHESCTDCPLYDHDKHRCPRFNKVIPTTIQEIMDTQTQRWIPVTERLPEEDGAYIVCLDDGSVFEYDYISKWWDDGAWQYCGKDVVAWMPLPEPYREEETHENR